MSADRFSGIPASEASFLADVRAGGGYARSLTASSPYGHKVQASCWAEWIPALFVPRQFVTMTYRDETSLNSVLRRHGHLVQQVNKKCFGSSWQRHGDGVSFVLGVEPQLRGVLHTHAVWDVEYVPYELIHSTMKKLGGMAWVEPVTSNCGVGHYVTKYAVKSGQVHVYLSRQIQALRQASAEVTLGGGRV